MDQAPTRSRSRTRHAFSKVPEVTAYFWIVKALTTAMGESTSDFLVHALVPQVAVVLGGIAFLIALYLQFTSTSASASPTSPRRSSTRSSSPRFSASGT
jgi:uncharacterized membrane-anchored protein